MFSFGTIILTEGIGQRKLRTTYKSLKFQMVDLKRVTLQRTNSKILRDTIQHSF